MKNPNVNDKYAKRRMHLLHIRTCKTGGVCFQFCVPRGATRLAVVVAAVENNFEVAEAVMVNGMLLLD